MMAVVMVLAASCNLTGKKSDGKDTDAQEQTAPADTTVISPSPDDAEEEISVPDNEKAAKIIAKFNQGPAINNIDYADALEYVEIYLSLTANDLKVIQEAYAADDKEKLDAAENAINAVEQKYPYNASLLQILYQAAALDKTEGGMVPMNDDNRARFEALVTDYDNIVAPAK